MSKEELQSPNEELTALNSQLHKTVERQRTTANDLQNILYSTNVATLILDTDLNIRLFTPATASLFKVIPSDVGRPLADLNSLAADAALPADATTVLRTLAPVEREIEVRTGTWYVRRILPYRNQDGAVEGVVITFGDISDRRRTADALRAAERQSQLATVAKSRFLAAASHDLRQPLQTLALLQGLLAKAVVGEKAQKLVSRLDEIVGAMSGMLNTLLDINQIDSGTVHPDIVRFPVDRLLEQLRDEFTYLAEAQRLKLHVVSCGASIESDPRLLEQIIRNLLSNALKYTKRGKVLLGCRRREGILSIEIWDTGIGIAADELQALFDEHHQVDNEQLARSRGLGLGLSIVQRLGKLLGHQVRVRSLPGKGSVFAIEIKLPTETPTRLKKIVESKNGIVVEAVRHTATIMVVEDDLEIRDLLELFLQDEGYRTVTAPDGIAALDLVMRGGIRPDLILADYNLPNGIDGPQLTAKLRERLQGEVPAVILTGNISTGATRDIGRHNCVQVNKPIKLKALEQVIQNLVAAVPSAMPVRPAPAAGEQTKPVVFVVDDDRRICEAIRDILEDDDRTVEDYESCEAFLEAYRPRHEACLLIDAYLPGMKGLELLRRLAEDGRQLPTIMMTGNSDVPMAVQAMKAGALDFIQKPISSADLLANVASALELSRDSSKLIAWRESAANHVAALTARQRQIMDLVLAGHPSKNIAADLGISQRTVENHRASIMKKTGTKSLPALARLVLAAASSS